MEEQVVEVPSKADATVSDEVEWQSPRLYANFDSVLYNQYMSIGANYTPDLNAALAKAQGQYPEKILFDKEIRVNLGKAGYVHRYASLAAIYAATREALSENGLSVIHTIHENIIRATLRHSSGQVIQSELNLDKYANKRWQDLGGSITYAARYVLAPLLGISGIDDTDAPLEEGAVLEEVRDINIPNAFDPASVKITSPLQVEWLQRNTGLDQKEMAKKLGVEGWREFDGTVLDAFVILSMPPAVSQGGATESQSNIVPQEGIPVPDVPV